MRFSPPGLRVVLRRRLPPARSARAVHRTLRTHCSAWSPNLIAGPSESTLKQRPFAALGGWCTGPPAWNGGACNVWLSMSDPVARLRLAACGIWVFSCACAVPLVWWASAPRAPGGPRSGTPAAALSADGRIEPGANRPTPLDVAAFNNRLWNPPPEPVVEAPPPLPPEPPRPPPAPAGPMPILLAILREQGALTAAVYNPVEDRVVVVRCGDVVLGREVARVTASTVELRAGASRATLTLDTELGGR